MHDHSQTHGYDRVRAHASEVVNERVDRLTEANLKRAAEQPEFVTRRLGELEREWDIDRAIMVVCAGMGSAALLLGLRKDWRWRFPLGAQIGSLLMHSIVGWAPPASVLRRLGFRTRQEIDSERQALLSARRAGFAPASNA